MKNVLIGFTQPLDKLDSAVPKAPLCKGGCHRKCGDWGIDTCLTTPPAACPAATSPYTGEAWVLPFRCAKLQFVDLLT